MKMGVIDQIVESFSKYKNRPALCIRKETYTYEDLSQSISDIRLLIREHIPLSHKHIGIMTNDDVETYATIFALWLEGKAYIPITPTTPLERNSFILNEVGSNFVLSSEKVDGYDKDYSVLITSDIQSAEINLEPSEFSESNLAYILFTSGSTGTPKGVPITFKNLDSLFRALDADSRHKIFSEDKCLQMFELNFDFSLVTFLYPLLNGASIYTIPKDQIKYFYIYKLILEEKLTYLVMVPSVIHYLRPYFSEINELEVRYCCFGAAPLDADIVLEWKKCIPNAILYNSYGPTEYTVTTTYYSLENNDTPKTRNGVVALGKPLDKVEAMVIDEFQNILKPGEEGELCLAGSQLTSGYWGNSQKNKESFFTTVYNGKEQRFYKTGDLCTMDEEQDITFIGRKDFQVKIRGYRVELSEIEFYAKEKLSKTNVIGIDITNDLGNTEIALIIESDKFDVSDLEKHLKNKLPDYMIPTQYKFMKEFPLNANGKINRKVIKNIL
ncbi:AMP-binding protein [uncultured Aquimarina sp.]|uniref:AMP-binding protein n=1 Tax=uncultured Aquimarina sp. TaxID=575652 RepID=UPI0026123714|nr:AMP-binding protein [uncultured Aquimarina sp.]